MPNTIAKKINGPKRIKRICCIGAGYVGGPTSAVIANKVPKIACTVVDVSEKRINAWNSDRLPIYEPKLDELVKLARDGVVGTREPNLFFSTNVQNAIDQADLIFISVNTPAKTSGLGAGKAIDIAYVESAARSIASSVSGGYKIIVEKSTVPCKTAEIISDILVANTGPHFSFDILSNPEFLAEGTAINDLLFPDRILIGSLKGQNPGTSELAAHALADMYANWIPRHRIILTDLWSSELAKIAANSMLAQRISSINTLSAICEATGADIDQVAHSVGLDKRIGPYMLKSSVGFGGSCFKKDVLSLVYLAESLDLPEVSAYWRSVVEINQWQKNRFTKRIVTQLYGSLAHKKIAVFGFAYKKNTGDTRESASISIVGDLIDERAAIAIYDPQVREEQIWHELRTRNNPEVLNECLTIYQSPYEACEGAHAVVIMTEWDEFRCTPRSPPFDTEQKGPIQAADLGKKPHRLTSSAIFPEKVETMAATATNGFLNGQGFSMPQCLEIETQQSALNWSRIAKLMKRPMFVFDGRNIVDAERLEELGFRVESIGKSRHCDLSTRLSSVQIDGDG